MTNREDEVDDEVEDWTPENDRDPEKRINKLLDNAEEHLKNLAAESRRPKNASMPMGDFQVPIAVGTPMFPVGGQIEIRKISNGFVMFYQKAIPHVVRGIPSVMYGPSPIEAFFKTAAEAMGPLTEALSSAQLLAESLARLDAFRAEQERTAGNPLKP